MANTPHRNQSAAPEANDGRDSKRQRSQQLSKHFADSIAHFLSTPEWKAAFSGWKEKFLGEFFSYLRAQQPLVATYKKLLGKKNGEKLSVADTADIQLSYHETAKNYVPWSEESVAEEAYSAAVWKAFLAKIDAAISKAPYGQEMQELWKKVRWNHTPRDIHDVQRLVNTFFRQADKKLTAAHKALLEKETINYSDVMGGGVEINEELFSHFLQAYASEVLAPVYENYQTKTEEIASIYRVPGFQRVLRGYDFSQANLKKHDSSLEATLKDPALTAEQKQQALHKAAVAMIAQKDKELGVLVEQLLAHDMNVARLSPELQQKYISRFRDEWSRSSEMKALDELLAKIDIDPKKRKELFDQVFDLSLDTLSFAGRDGKTHTIPFHKKIIDRSRKGDNLSDTLGEEIPLVFFMPANDLFDAEYLQTVSREKPHAMKDAQANDIQIFPGNFVEITSKDGKKEQGYIYRDADGNIILRAQPWAEKKTVIRADKVSDYTARVVEPTYAFTMNDVPTIITHAVVLDKASQMSDEQIRDSLQERNNDIASEILREDIGKSSEPLKDQDIVALEQMTDDQMRALEAAQLAHWNKDIQDRLSATSQQHKHLDNALKNQEKNIQNLEAKLSVLAEKKPVDKKQLDNTTYKLQEAKRKLEDMKDEKQQLEKREASLDAAQEKIWNELQARQEEEGPAEGKDTTMDFLRTWADINGDRTIPEPLPGKTCLMALIPESASIAGWGGGAWIRGDVTAYNPSTHQIKIRWYGVEWKLQNSDGVNFEGHEATINGVEGLKELKRMLTRTYKFRKYHSVAEFGLALKWGFAASDDVHADASTHFHFDKKYEGRWKHLKDDINFASMKHQRTGKDIRYFGKKSGEKRTWFKVEPQGENILVEEISYDDKENKIKKMFSKKMTANDFMMFAMEKDLRGYTQEDVDEANEGKWEKWLPIIIDKINTYTQPEVRFGKGLFHVKWGSIAWVKSSWEMIKKGIKEHFDEKNKKSKSAVEDAMLKSGWFNAMKKFPIIWPAFEDMEAGFESKKESEKKKKINEYKDEVDQKKAPDSNGASNFIKASIGDINEAKKAPLKAAGYYLYALQEGGNPYFRALKEYQGQGWRVERILWPDYVPQYKAYIANIKAELVKDPNNTDLKIALYKDELWFFNSVYKTDKPQLDKLFGTWFFTWGLGQAYNIWYNGAGIHKTYEGDDKHKSFGELHGDSWPGFFEAFRVNDMIAYSKLLSEKVGPSDENYYKWWGFMLMPFMNGQYRQYMNNSFQYEMVKLAKKAAFPFAGYMTEGNGMEKLQNLFDLVSEGSLSSAMEDAKKDDANKGKGEISIRTAGFKKWWESKGRKTLDTLQNPKELFALKKKLEAQRGDQEKLNQYNTLVDYIDHKYNDEDRDNITDTFGAESAMYQKNIFSAPSGFVKGQMLEFANGQFKGKAEKHGPALWEALKGKLSDIQNIPEEEMTPDFFAFILKRYFTMFQSRYTSSSAKKTFIAALKYRNIPDIFQINVRWVFDKKFGGTDLPGEVEDTLIIFEKLFQKYAPIIQRNPEILADVFGDERIVDYYINATEKDTISATNTLKQRQNDIKRAAERGEFDSDDEGGGYAFPWFGR